MCHAGGRELAVKNKVMNPKRSTRDLRSCRKSEGGREKGRWLHGYVIYAPDRK